MRVQCILEPRGHSSLEGYQLNEMYPAEKREAVKGEGPRPAYYRVWPDVTYDPDYYECCSVRSFNKFFKEVK
jgi:hypothetical protein